MVYIQNNKTLHKSSNESSTHLQKTIQPSQTIKNKRGGVEFGIHDNQIEKQISKKRIINFHQDSFKMHQDAIPNLGEKIKKLLLKSNVHPLFKTNIYTLLHILEKNIKLGCIMKHSSKDNRLHIFNCTSIPYRNSSLWDSLTLLIRATILKIDPMYMNGEYLHPRFIQIIGMTWPKFFNIGECVDIDYIFNNCVNLEVTVKLDGSLGIIIFDNDIQEWICTSKGSFYSSQAQFANKLLMMNKDSINKTFNVNHTYIVEIIFKKNKIIVDYDKYEGLTLIGAFDNTRGIEYTYEELKATYTKQPIKCLQLVTKLNLTTFDEIKDYINLNRDNKNMIEGVVIRYYMSNGANHRIKWKTDQYLTIEKNKNNLTPQTVFKLYKNHSLNDLNEFKYNLPEELHGLVDEYVKIFDTQIKNIVYQIINIYKHLFSQFSVPPDIPQFIELYKKEYKSSKNHKIQLAVLIKILKNNLSHFEKNFNTHHYHSLLCKFIVLDDLK